MIEVFGINVQIVIAVIVFVQAIATTVIGGLFARGSERHNLSLAKAERRAAVRSEEALLTMNLMSACLNLGLATATAIKHSDGKVNGSMDGAIEEAEKAETAYHNFIKKIAAKHMADGKG